MQKVVARTALKNPGRGRDRAHWLSPTPEERFASVEQLRREAAERDSDYWRRMTEGPRSLMDQAVHAA